LRRLNAFDVLGKVSSKAKDKGKDRDGVIGKMVRKEWLAEEAEESDEDQAVGFGFIKRKSGEEDEEGDNADLDATLPELVDDQKMDEDTEGADRVIEKHQ
jgi:mediator of replication checkpoint protein 1